MQALLLHSLESGQEGRATGWEQGQDEMPAREQGTRRRQDAWGSRGAKRRSGMTLGTAQAGRQGNSNSKITPGASGTANAR